MLSPKHLPNRRLLKTRDLEVKGVGSRTTQYRLRREDPDYPDPIERRGVLAWFEDEIDAYLETRKRRSIKLSPIVSNDTRATV